jgi:hypothetical protein
MGCGGRGSCSTHRPFAQRYYHVINHVINHVSDQVIDHVGDHIVTKSD